MSKAKPLTNKMPGSIKDAINALKDEHARLTREKANAESRKAEIEAERNGLLLQPLTPGEIKAFMSELIDHRAETYLATLAKEDVFAKMVQPRRHLQGNGALTLADADHALGRSHANDPTEDRLLDGGFHLPLFYTQERFGGWAYFFLGDLMKAKLDEVLAASPSWPKDGTIVGDAASLQLRRQRIAESDLAIVEIDKEIFGLAAQLDEISHQFSPKESQPEESEEERERRFWAKRLNIDPKTEPERFEYEMKRQREYAARLAEDQRRAAPGSI
ncbi:hypothetical protein [Variovorax sp.]|uniref:hypothetical protein n=1 Tax=Variovorax sp. TaxID=1871043 RepID=UPI003BAD8FE9